MAASEGTLDVVLKAINEKFESRDPYFLAGIFVSVFVVIMTIGKLRRRLLYILF